MLKLLESVEEKSEQLTTRLIDPKVIADNRLYSQLSREQKELLEVIAVGGKYREIVNNIEEAENLLKESDDEEMIQLAEMELTQAREELPAIERNLKLLLTPRDPNDSKNVVVEIRAGTGGDEAGLFTADLYRMYSRFAEKNNYKIEILSSNQTGVGGFKEIIFSMSGENIYACMKFESGVHRVQRVPATESSGRIHTSASSVAVLAEADEVDVIIDPHDLKIDVYRSSGPGGQSVNTTDSAVRITHEPTGLVVTCQDEKSQHKNKAKALKVLRARLLDKAHREHNAKIADKRKSMIGSGDRSAKIRTYNFPEKRVTDHRIHFTLHKLDEILAGDLEPVIKALQMREQEDRLKQAGESLEDK